MISRRSPLLISTLCHLSLLIAFASYFFSSPSPPPPVEVEVRVIEQPKLAPQADIDLTKPPPPPAPPEPEARKVFGVTRDSLTSNDPSSSVDAKAGNTLVTAPDNEILKDDDATRLPIPVEEYLITAPPQLLESFKPQYPPQARSQNIEGAVKVEILIDRDGRVRDARVIQGLGFGTEEAALEAAQRLKFKPAEVSGQAVAVRIQFIIHFELER